MLYIILFNSFFFYKNDKSIIYSTGACRLSSGYKHPQPKWIMWLNIWSVCMFDQMLEYDALSKWMWPPGLTNLEFCNMQMVGSDSGESLNPCCFYQQSSLVVEINNCCREYFSWLVGSLILSKRHSGVTRILPYVCHMEFCASNFWNDNC